MKLKSNKGFTGVDAAVAITILLIFVTFVASLFYNLANTSKRVERKAIATNLAIEVIEALKITEFSVLEENMGESISVDKNAIEEITGEQIIIPNGYGVKITIANPNTENINPEEAGQIVKLIKSEVSYTENNHEQTVMIETLVKNIQ